VWARNACQVETRWLGYTEIGQTHVVRTVGETRRAPRIVAEREAELLFFPTLDAQPTVSPSSAPTATVNHVFGLELIGNFTVDLVNASNVWGSGYPSNKTRLIEPSTEYYIPGNINDIDINFDLQAQRTIQGVAVQIWYYSEVQSIQIGVRRDGGTTWTLFNGGSATSLNQRVTITIPKTAARYVSIRLRGGTYNGVFDTTKKWGLRQVQISGSLDGSLVDTGTNTTRSPSAKLAFIPSQSAIVMLDVFNQSGALLGTMPVRNQTLQRPLLEQALVTSKLDPYSLIDMWSVTIPWRWMKEGNQLRISVNHTLSGKILTHSHTLSYLVQWGEHTFIRTKVAIFGNSTDIASLNSFTYGASKLATGMFAAMPLATLSWVDSELWHLPYLVVATANGARLVRSEAERRQAFIDAGQTDYGTEPQWEVLKNQLTFRHSMANVGRGFAETTDDEYTPYASQTSIFMGWSLTGQQADGSVYWDYLGYWDGWIAAAWTGWCAMAPGDECGNALIHELGHSQTMEHFTSGTSVSWGIADEYPMDGVNTKFNPWGYDTVSRRFRTWYNPYTNDGKNDPMNGGEDPNSETCFPQYTAYHAQKSQNWAKASPVLLSSKTSGVPSDGAYLFNEATRNYDKVTDAQVVSLVDSYAMPPVKVGVPVLTFIGTLGKLLETCQIYPPVRSSAGNTFRFPDPFDLTLVASLFSGARYYVEVTYATGTKMKGLVAVPDLSSSTATRFFSFNIAIADQPTKVDLYRYNSVSYPNIVSTSATTLLFTRTINLPAQPLDGIAATVKVGRGWLGESGDIDISKICISDLDCEEKSTVLKWRGTESISYSSVVPSSNLGNRSAFNVTVTRMEDKSTSVLTVLATRFTNEISASLLSSLPSPVAADSTHGVKFWIPYDLNSAFSFGTYKALIPAVTASNPDGSRFADLRVNLNLYIPQVTATVNLTKGYTSPGYTAPGSSAYFLVTDPSVGPTTSEWWGGDSTSLSVPLISFNCNKKMVKASIIGTQTSCFWGGAIWQMNAGRSADSCAHFLMLTLASSSLNTWMIDPTLKGCKFETHPINPIQVNAHRWHDPNGDAVIGRMVLKMVSQL